MEPTDMIDKRQGERRMSKFTFAPSYQGQQRRIGDRRMAAAHYRDLAKAALFDEVVAVLRKCLDPRAAQIKWLEASRLLKRIDALGKS